MKEIAKLAFILILGPATVAVMWAVDIYMHWQFNPGVVICGSMLTAVVGSVLVTWLAFRQTGKESPPGMPLYHDAQVAVEIYKKHKDGVSKEELADDYGLSAEEIETVIEFVEARLDALVSGD